MLWGCGGIGIRGLLRCWWSWLRGGLRRVCGRSLWFGGFGGRLGLWVGRRFGVECFRREEERWMREHDSRR